LLAVFLVLLPEKKTAIFLSICIFKINEEQFSLIYFFFMQSIRLQKKLITKVFLTHSTFTL